MSEKYDAVVIGSGQAGGPLATAMGKAGWKTALIEREHVGGTCINEGCTPTKTMVASARVAYLARRAGDYGVGVGPITVDMARVRQRKRDMVERFRRSSEKRIQGSENVDLIYGEGSFAGTHSLVVRSTGSRERYIEAPRIVVDTGTRPALPGIPGLDRVTVLDSTSVMELDAVPEHLI
ncbi:MAG TPA: FAD-dependent oxidoreductase, partial [Chloroflexota bacterium]